MFFKLFHYKCHILPISRSQVPTSWTSLHSCRRSCWPSPRRAWCPGRRASARGRRRSGCGRTRGGVGGWWVETCWCLMDVWWMFYGLLMFDVWRISLEKCFFSMFDGCSMGFRWVFHDFLALWSLVGNGRSNEDFRSLEIDICKGGI